MVEGFYRQKMKNKIFSLLAIALLLTPFLPIPSAHATLIETAKKQFNPFNKDWSDIRHYLGDENFEHARLILYLLVLGIYTWNITSDILLNLNTYILMNPSPIEPSVLNVMNFFIFNLQVVFILAIAATALYIVFSSPAPKKRAKAKSMLGRLVMGMLLVSISPYIMKLFFDLSSGMTGTILNQADSSVAATEYTDIIWKLYFPQVLIIVLPMAGHSLEYNAHHVIKHELPNMQPEYFGNLQTGTANEQRDLVVEELLGQGAPEAIIADDADQIMNDQRAFISSNTKKMIQSKVWGTIEYGMRYMKIAPHPEQTFAYLMAEIAMIFALYGFLALRYIMLMIWVILFPLSLFLSSFELTRGLGRNMIEQTVFWTILQIFYAVSIDVIAVGFSILPKGYDYFGVGLNYTGGMFFISFFSLAAAILLMLTPILVLMLSQRLTQMDLG